jgi:hypothetical protein
MITSVLNRTILKSLVDDLLLPTFDLIVALGERHHFSVEIQTAISIVRIQRLQDS